MHFFRAEKGYQLTEQYLAHEILNALGKHYPGWGWGLNINAEKNGGVVTIEQQELTLKRQKPFGMNIHLPTLYDDPDLKKVISLAGFMLEFCGFPQKKPDDYEVDLTVFNHNRALYKKEMHMGLKIG
jgi:hypothetical protein